VKEKYKLKIEYALLSVASLMNMLILSYRILRGNMEFQDFHARWQECAYLLRGINPFTALSGEFVIDSIGPIDPDMVTVPWAWIWGNIINPGFLPYELAKVWGMLFYLTTIIITSIMCAKYIGNAINCDSKRHWMIITGMVVIAQYNLVWSFMCGNHGALACCFIIQAIIIIDTHPYLAGVLMTLALIKPQVALPFLFMFLLLHKFRILITTFLLEVVTITSVCIITGLGLLELLSGTASVGTNLEGVYFGLFNMLKYTGIPTGIILAMDMVVGIALVVWLFLRTTSSDNYMSMFVPCAIASTFWFYKQPHDMVILAIPLMVTILRVINSSDEHDVWLTMIIQVVLLGVFYGQSILRKIVVMITPSITEYYSKELFMTITSFVLIAICIVMELKLKRGKEF